MRMPHGRGGNPSRQNQHHGPQNSTAPHGPQSAQRGSGRNSNGLGGMDDGPGIMGSLLSSVASGRNFADLAKAGLYGYAAYETFQMLRGFVSDLANGTTYDLRRNKGEPTLRPEQDPVLQANLQTVAGKEALTAGKLVDQSLQGNSGTDQALSRHGHSGLSSQEAGSFNPDAAAGLQSGMKGQVIRIALPGGNGETVDYPVGAGAVNDRSALADFQKNYPDFAKANGLPEALPPGASLTIGAEQGFFAGKAEPAREYRYASGTAFVQNKEMDGTLDNPGSKAWSEDPKFQSGDLRFDASQIAANSKDLVRASDVKQQAVESSLITHSQTYTGTADATVKTPVSFASSLLGRRENADFAELADSIGAEEGTSKLQTTLDVRTGDRSIGVVGTDGAVSLTSGQAGDRLSLSRYEGGLSTTIDMARDKGSLGSFNESGTFVGNEAAATAMTRMSGAAAAAQDNAVLDAASEQEGIKGKAVNINMTPGNESVTTRVAYNDRVVDYHARNGSMTMIELDARTGVPREASIVRSDAIRVTDGKLSMDQESAAIVQDHVRLAAEGRPGSEFSKLHPETKNQFASLADVGGQGPSEPGPAVADRGGRGPDLNGPVLASLGPPGPAVESGGSTASQIRQAALQEATAAASTPVSAGSSVTPQTPRKSSGMEIGG